MLLLCFFAQLCIQFSHRTTVTHSSFYTGFEGSDVVNLNTELAKLLRSAIRGGGPPRARSSTNSQAPKHGKDGPLRGTATSKQRAENSGDNEDYEERSTPSIDEDEEWAATAAAAPDQGPCPTSRSLGPDPRRPDPPRIFPVVVSGSAREAEAFMGSMINGDQEPHVAHSSTANRAGTDRPILES